VLSELLESLRRVASESLESLESLRRGASESLESLESLRRVTSESLERHQRVPSESLESRQWVASEFRTMVARVAPYTLLFAQQKVVSTGAHNVLRSKTTHDW